MASEHRMLIDGKLVEASSGATFENVNPATETLIGVVSDGGAPEVDQAIAAARSAFDDTAWSTDRNLRSRCLEQLAAALDAEREEFRPELVAETGSPIALTYATQLDGPINESFSYLRGMIDRYPWEEPIADDGRGQRMVIREPVGVVGAIVPWNFPVEVTLTKLGHILAAGCTAVLKPAPDTPFNATRLGRIIAEQTDIPPGVVNIVTSSDHLVGEALVTDPRVDEISFTGSTATGRRIMSKASDSVKRLFLELGGKSANIVLDDVDLAAVLPYASSACAHAGQGCGMHTRLLLPRGLYEEGIEILKSAFEAVPYGDPTDPSVIMGPVINQRQLDRVLGHIQRGVEEGARLVTGGGRPSHLSKGYFIEPTLFADVDNSMSIAREEVFGPVLAVIPYSNVDEAIAIANDSPYGLVGGVVAGTEERGMEVARRLRVGAVAVGMGASFYEADIPFGGYKQSGVGRQNGREGFEQYLQVKSIGRLPR